MHLFVTRVLLVLVAVTTGLSLGACTPYANGPAHGLDSILAMELPPDRPYNQEIGDRVENLLRNARHLNVVAVISQTAVGGGQNIVIRGGTDPITARSSMTWDSDTYSLVTLVYDKDLALIRGFFLNNGRIQELIRNDDGQWVVTESDSPFDHGTDNPIRKHEIDCLIGVHTLSWIGIPAKNDLPYPALDRAGKIRNRIVSGVREADTLEFGRWCHVFRQRFPPEGEATLEHVEYIDRESGLNRRWDTIQIQDGVWRKRRYYIMNTDPVPGGLQLLWDTHVSHLVEKK